MATNRSVRPARWSYDAALVAGLVGLTAALAAGALLDLDLAVRDWVDAHRPPPAYWLARALNLLGQGGMLLLPVSVGLALALTWRTRSVRPLLVIAATFVVTYVTIGPLKLLTDRGYPHAEHLPHPERLFSDPVGGTAYPSGHVANAVVWYGVIALLLAALLRAYGRRAPGRAANWALRVLPVAVVFATTTYLGYHWLTDAVAGLLLGLLIDRMLRRAPWDTLPLPDRLAGWRQPAQLGRDRF
ncbi:MAG TPA: phosphatase PAP2 family protein [Pilimelia sp.]|nr:phosphatase PAP2 family protein [Pilimelia sp.]